MIARHPVDVDCFKEVKLGHHVVRRLTTTFQRDYLAALVQLSQQTVTVVVPKRFKRLAGTRQFPIHTINGVKLHTQISDARKGM